MSLCAHTVIVVGMAAPAKRPDVKQPTHLGHLEQFRIELVHLPQFPDPHAEADDSQSIKTGEREEDEQGKSGQPVRDIGQPVRKAVGTT